jgi:DNA polymerase (family 10)
LRELDKPALDVKLTSLGGIGADLAGKITELAKTGTTEILGEVRDKWPASVRQLLGVTGLGPKRVKLLFEKLKVETVDDLKRAVDAGALSMVPGLGGSLEKKLKDTLALTVKKSGANADGRFPLSVVEPIAAEFVQRLKAMPGVSAAEAAGSYRRKKSSVGDLDILVIAGDGTAVIDAFTKFPGVLEVIAAGDTKGSVRLDNGLQVDVRVVEKESYGAALLYFTGSKGHSIELRSAAIKLGLKLNEYGVWKGDTKLAGETEDEMYAALGMKFLPPEKRER